MRARSTALPAAALAAAALAGCAGPSRAGREAGDADRVALHFAWPDGLRMRVAVRHESWRTGRPPAGALIRHRVVVERRGEELWVSNRDVEGEGNEPDLDVNLKVGQVMVQVAGLDGAFRRSEGLDEAVALLRPGDDAERARARETLDRINAHDWETSVGAWRGLTLAPGALRRKEVAGFVPLVPGVPARVEVEYGLEAAVPCGEEETERRCASLVYRGG
ncbi:MAG TPA: hypothetical protein VFI16_04060, partial [Anaeromyxobacteraceae bacterium]|nr:hypothetical protein [Anaeromyxobacteraceae bacterium]